MLWKYLSEHIHTATPKFCVIIRVHVGRNTRVSQESEVFRLGGIPRNNASVIEDDVAVES